MSADWQAGDRAVCVDDSLNPDARHQHHLVRGTTIRKGNVYLIDGVVLRYFKQPGWRPRLLLAGESLIWTPTGEEYGFELRRFRKLVPACDLARRHAEGVEG